MCSQSRAQNMAEYAIIIAVVSAALLSMSVYIKRGMQGRLRDLAVQISPRQYENSNTTSSFNVTKSATITESRSRGSFSRDVDESTTRTGSETIIGGN